MRQAQQLQLVVKSCMITLAQRIPNVVLDFVIIKMGRGLLEFARIEFEYKLAVN